MNEKRDTLTEADLAALSTDRGAALVKVRAAQWVTEEVLRCTWALRGDQTLALALVVGSAAKGHHILLAPFITQGQKAPGKDLLD